MAKFDLEKDPLAGGKIVKKLGANVFSALKIAVHQIAGDVATQAATKDAPKATGYLRENIHESEGAYIADDAAGRTTIVAEVLAQTLYAAIQHQNENFHHINGRAFYLTAPAKERKDRHQGLIQKAVTAAMKRTKGD